MSSVINNTSFLPLSDLVFVNILKWVFIEEDTNDIIKVFKIPKDKAEEKHYTGYCVVCCDNSFYLYKYSAFESVFNKDKINGFLYIDLDSWLCEQLNYQMTVSAVKENMFKRIFKSKQ